MALFLTYWTTGVRLMPVKRANQDLNEKYNIVIDAPKNREGIIRFKNIPL
jgi:hypothetical protein